MNVDQVIAGYIQLRDQKDAMKKRHTEEMAPLLSKMQKLEAWLQTHLTSQGITSQKGASGTAYLKEVSSATVEDRAAFFAYCRDNDMWDLLETRCAKTVVDEFVEKKGELPPGIKYTRETVCQIRRGS
jgi:hypothetical protein